MSGVSSEPSPPRKFGNHTASILWYSFEILLLTSATVYSVHLRLTERLVSAELLSAFALLSFNGVLAIGMLLRKGPHWSGGPVGFGLILITAKVFVNTFTILSLIGLQAVRTPVFVPVFFVGYFVLLTTTVWALHRTAFET